MVRMQIDYIDTDYQQEDAVCQPPSPNAVSPISWVLSVLFFCLIVPLTHSSGKIFHRKWRFYQPLRGGTRFILFQTLSWFFYGLCLTLAISGLILWSRLARYTFGLVTSFGVFGVLSQAFMVTSIFVYERHHRKRAASRNPIPPPHEAASPPDLGSDTASTCPRRAAEHSPVVPTAEAAGAEMAGLRNRNGTHGSDAASHTVPKLPTPRPVKAAIHLLEPIFDWLFVGSNMALACVAVLLAVLAETCWSGRSVPEYRDFARVAGVLSAVLFTILVFNTYGVGGHIRHGHSLRGWRFWQPLVGGAKFILLQALSWTFLTVSLLLELCFVISTLAIGFELFVGAAVVAGVFFLLSELLMILSLRVYIPDESEGGTHTRVRLTSKPLTEETLEQFRRLTVVTVLSNMQYLPFLLPILPLLACGLSMTDATVHWCAFFCCLAAGVVVNAYVKNLLARSKRPQRRSVFLARALSICIHTSPILGMVVSKRPEASWAWAVLSCTHILYVALTFRNSPEITGRRFLGPQLQFWKGGWSLQTFMSGVDQYFKARLLWRGTPDLSKPHILAFHPHGVQPFTVFWIQTSAAWRQHMGDRRFSIMTASVVHYVPFMRDILQWLGGREVSRQSILYALDRGESLMLVPGGQQEMLEAQSGAQEIRVVTTHVGFIRIAMENGVPLVPVLSFGETEVLDFVRVPKLQRFFIKRIGMPIPFFPYGLFGFPIPRPTPITVVFGEPIQVKRIAHPTAEDVESMARLYFRSIRQLFESSKHEAAGHEAYRLTFIGPHA